MRHYVTWAIGFAFLIISHQSIFNVNIYVIVLSNRTKLNTYTLNEEKFNESDVPILAKTRFAA